MPSPVSRVDLFCDFALNTADTGLEVGSNALFCSFGCHLWLLFGPVGRSHMWCPLSSLVCVISKSQLSKLPLHIHRNSKTYRLYILRVQRPFVSTIIAQRPILPALLSSSLQSGASGTALTSSSAPLVFTQRSSAPTSRCIRFFSVFIHLLQTSLS